MIIRYDSVAFNVCALCKYWSACNDMWSQMFENLTLCACSVDQNKPQEYVDVYIVHAHMFMYTRIELARLCLDDTHEDGMRLYHMDVVLSYVCDLLVQVLVICEVCIHV
jgi:hypothetical protein